MDNEADAQLYERIAGTLDRGIDFVSTAAHAVPADGWDAQSPCDRWTARQVMGHLIGVQRLGLGIVKGEPVDNPSLEPVEVGSDPAAEWDELAVELKEAFDGLDLSKEVDSGRGMRSIGNGMSFPTMDLYLHGWDIAKSAGVEVTIPDDVIEFVRQFVATLPPEQLRSPRTFGPEKQAPEGATETQKLMAFTGRDV